MKKLIKKEIKKDDKKEEKVIYCYGDFGNWNLK